MIYFDNSATSFIKPESVYNKVYEVIKKYAGNAGRSGHCLSLKANDIVFEARELVAQFFNIDSVERICFTPNATYALNFAIKGCIKKGDKVLISGFEHNSVLRPLYEIGADVNIMPWYNIDEYIEISKILDDVKVIIVNHMSNVNGNLADIATIGKLAKEKGVIFIVDASQSAGHIDIDVKRDGVDILACAGHKGLFGPQGTGILYVNENVKLKTIIEGGTGSQSELLSQPENLPDRFEVGTLNVPAIAGLAEGIKFLLCNKKIQEYEKELSLRLINGLKTFQNIEVYDNKNKDIITSVISFNFKNTDCVTLSNYLSEKHKIMIRSGLHCAPIAHKTIGTFESGTARLSLSYFNTFEEVDMFLEIIDKKRFI